MIRFFKDSWLGGGVNPIEKYESKWESNTGEFQKKKKRKPPPGHLDELLAGFSCPTIFCGGWDMSFHFLYLPLLLKVASGNLSHTDRWASKRIVPSGILKSWTFATALYDSDSSIHTKMCVCVQVHVVYMCILYIYIYIYVCICGIWLYMRHVIYTTLSSVLDFGVDILQRMSFTNQAQQGSWRSSRSKMHLQTFKVCDMRNAPPLHLPVLPDWAISPSMIASEINGWSAIWEA